MSKLEVNGARERVVLIVDDEEPNRQLLSALLSAQGYSVKIACDGPSAIAQVEAGGIDLILLDVMMPGMDGIEACQRIRKELGLSEVTIVFVTALSDRESRMRAKLAGADDFLVKPIDSFELTFRVANWMKLRALRDFELCTAELEQRLNEASLHAAAAAQRLGELHAQLADGAAGSELDRAQKGALLEDLGMCLSELGELSARIRRPLETRVPGGLPSQVVRQAAPVLNRNQRT